MVSNKKTKKILLFVLLGFLILLVLLFILNKTHVINLAGSPSRSLDGNNKSSSLSSDLGATSKSNSTNTSEQESPPSKSGQDTVTNPTPESMKDATIGIVITNASQDFAQGAVYVNTRISGVVGGKCTLELTKGVITITKTADIFMAGTYYSCDGFVVNYSELSQGTWTARVVVVNTYGKTNETTKTLTVN